MAKKKSVMGGGGPGISFQYSGTTWLVTKLTMREDKKDGKKATFVLECIDINGDPE